MRKRLATQRAETRVEQKNNELLRNEIALLKTQVGRTETTAAARAEVQSLRDGHLKEMSDLKAEQQKRLARINQEHGAALSEVRRLAERDISELRQQLQSRKLVVQANESVKVKELNREIEALQRQNTSLEQKLTGLQHKLREFPEQVRVLQQKLRDFPEQITNLERQVEELSRQHSEAQEALAAKAELPGRHHFERRRRPHTHQGCGAHLRESP